MGVCGNVCCVAAVVKESVFLSLGVLKINYSSSSSCHQTIFFHSSAHCFPTSLNIIRSSKEQGCASWEHCNMCDVVSSAFPQAHVVSPV